MATLIELERPLFVTREGAFFSIGIAPASITTLVSRVRTLPYASYQAENKIWRTPVCVQSVALLREWFLEGLLDRPAEHFLTEGEELPQCLPATLRAGSLRRPYLAQMATRNDGLYARLLAIPGAQWDRRANGVSFPQIAVVSLWDLMDRGILSDPERLTTPAAVTIGFDNMTGDFRVRGDARAAEAFKAKFPATDVVSVWRTRNLDIGFVNDFAEEMYRGEVARHGPGVSPAGLRLSLYPHQQQNIAVALERSGLGVFDTPGVGKTATAIAVGHELVVNRQSIPRVVVVVPGQVRTQWAQEITRFTGCTDVVVVDGDKARRKNAYEAAARARWLVVHYDVLRLDTALLAPLVRGALLVADEAHRLTSPTAKRTVVMRQFTQLASRRLALTGTPLSSLPGEWFSVLSGFAIPGCLGSATDYLNRYQFPGRFGGYEGARNLDELYRRSLPFYVRHTKEQVATHLPPLRVQPVPLDPTDHAYAQALRRAHQAAVGLLKEAALAKRGLTLEDDLEEIATGAEMTAVGMLRLLCLSPRLVHGSESAAAGVLKTAGLIPEIDGPKLDYLRSLALQMQENEERVVVFSSSLRMIELCAARLREDGVRFVEFTGVTSGPDRELARAAFTTPPTATEPGPTVMLATDAGAEGLNLGGACSTLVNLDIPWTPSRLEQRSNRIHRIDGTSPNYLVLNLTVRGTIEDGILKMVENKADLADAIFGEAGGRRRTTGRAGRNIFEQALHEWSAAEPAPEHVAPRAARSPSTDPEAEAPPRPARKRKRKVEIEGV